MYVYLSCPWVPPLPILSASRVHDDSCLNRNRLSIYLSLHLYHNVIPPVRVYQTHTSLLLFGRATRLATDDPITYIEIYEQRSKSLVNLISWTYTYIVFIMLCASFSWEYWAGCRFGWYSVHHADRVRSFIIPYIQIFSTWVWSV